MEILVVIIVLFLYFLPSFISSGRGHKGSSQVFVVNLLLGWTGLGWIIALIWAFSSDVRAVALNVNNAPKDDKDKLISDMACAIERLTKKLDSQENPPTKIQGQNNENHTNP